jgi:hypothetical protein
MGLAERTPLFTMLIALPLSAQPASQPQLLTVSETLGLAFVPMVAESFESAMRLAGEADLANPEAKPQLHTMLADPSLHDHWAKIVVLLARVGDASDVPKLERFLRVAYAGKITRGEDRRALEAGVRGLGNLAKRGVPGALDTLRRMCDLEYWADLPYTWPSEGEATGSITRYEMAGCSLAAYARGGGEDWAPMVERHVLALRQLGWEKQIMTRITVESVRANLEASNKSPAEVLPVPSPERRRELAARFNGDLEHPGPARPARVPAPVVVKPVPRPLAGDAAETAAAEAIAAFEEFRQAFLNRDITAVLGRLLSDGEPRPPDALDHMTPQEIAEGIAEGIEIERRILDTKAFREARFVRLTATQTGDADKSIITVTFKLDGTQDLVKEYFPDSKGSDTFTADDCLLLIMKKIDGQWYWNPFGG